ncbi:spore gernimation protein GerPD [Gracilibacillus alcaliphilus]|uniref:spore gernimation protein GerPD n=1 Tax=Gracilibacillus alcaliphilus TaxID=1401441 RepID=UPI0019581783|nr:spore gernimation protein GerPD [Gracilibacillus alcaliphilus]MBM7675430.1 spore germination protein PD [Gracilibacillus alcaliphilus]
MYYQVNNHHIGVGNISILGVSSSSLCLVGDSHHIQLASLFDTPPESYIVGLDSAEAADERLINLANTDD